MLTYGPISLLAWPPGVIMYFPYNIILFHANITLFRFMQHVQCACCNACITHLPPCTVFASGRANVRGATFLHDQESDQISGLTAIVVYEP
jgi:hypothetical protein